MKKTLFILSIVFGMSFVATTTHAASVFQYFQGGTGTTTAPISQLIYGGGSSYQSVPTTTASCTGSASCTAFTIIGSTPVSISASGGTGGSGTVSTSTNEQQGFLSYWTSNSATPALLGKVATSSIGSGTGLTFSGTAGAQVGGTSGTYSVNTTQNITTLSNLTTGAVNVNSGVLYNTSTSTPTVSAPITYSGTLGQFISGVSGTFGCTTSSSGVTGCLAGTDWITFNNKISSTSLSGGAGINYVASTGVISNTGVTSNVAGNGISLSGSTGAVTITNTIGYPFPNNATTSSITFGGVTVTGAATGCATFTTGVLTSTGSACGSGGGATFGNPFNFVQATVNYLIPTTTSTGLIVSASSTIGNGNQNGGLTVSGGATTTGNLIVNGVGTPQLTVGTSSNYAQVAIHANATNATIFQTLFAIGSSTSGATTTLFSVSNTGAITTNLSGSGFVKTSGAGSALSVDTNAYDTFAYPFFGGAGFNSTSTGLIISASSTVGGGAQNTGLTISGGATTTGFLAVQGNGTSSILNGLNVGTSGGCLAFNNVCISTVISNVSAFKAASNYATIVALPANTYGGGVLTEVGTGALSVDGASPAVGNRILVKNEATQTNNGIYVVTATGSGIAAYVLTRASDFNTSADIYPGVSTYILSGTANSDDVWTLTTPAPVTLDSSNLTFAESANGNITLPISVTNGGTGQTTLPTSQLLYGAGVGNVQSAATTSVSCSGTVSCSGFTVIGTSPITLSGSTGVGNWFTPNSYNGVGVNSTSTGIWLTATNPFSLIASSTFVTTASSTIEQSASNASFASASGSLHVGTTTASTVFGQTPGILVDMQNNPTSEEGLTVVGNVNDFLENNVWNRSAGTGAQSCFTGTRNDGSATTAFLSGCVNSTGFNNPQAYNIGNQGDANLLSMANDFWIGQGSAGRSLYFTNGGVGTSSIALAIGTTNNVGIGSSTPFAKLSVQGKFGDTGQFLFAVSSSTLLATTTSFIITNAGNVGIGTYNPFASLTVIASTTASTTGSILSTENILATSTSQQIDWRGGNQQLVRIGKSATTISFVPNSFLAGMTLRVVVCNPPDASAGALTWSPAVPVMWTGGTVPTQTSTLKLCDMYSFVATNGTSSLEIFGAQSASFQ